MVNYIEITDTITEEMAVKKFKEMGGKIYKDLQPANIRSWKWILFLDEKKDIYYTSRNLQYLERDTFFNKTEILDNKQIMNSLPKYWVVKATRDDNRWHKVIDYINLQLKEEKFEWNNYWKYYGYDWWTDIEINHWYNTWAYTQLNWEPDILTIDEFLTLSSIEEPEEPEDKYQIYLEWRNAPRRVHNNILEAEKEARRLVKTYNSKAYVVKIMSTFENKVIKSNY